MPEKQEPFDIRDTESYKALARSADKKRLAQFTQQVYEDAMERAINAVRVKATIQGRHGSVPVSIGALEAEIAIRQELTELAGGRVRIVEPSRPGLQQ